MGFVPQPEIEPPRRALYSSSAIPNRTPDRHRPILCDCGKRAGYLEPHVYYCEPCAEVIRVFPSAGRVVWAREQWTAEHGEPIPTEAYFDSLALEPEDTEFS